MSGHSHITLSFDRPSDDTTDRGGDVSAVPCSHLPWLKRYAFSAASSIGHHDFLFSWPDIVLVHSLFGYHFTWAVRRAVERHLPVLVVPHGALDPYCFSYRARRKRLWLAAHRKWLTKVSFLYSSPYERHAAEPYVQPRSEHVIMWPVQRGECPQTNHIPAANAPDAEARQLLYVGRLHPMKRIRETVRSFAHIADPRWRLLIAGPESQEVTANDLARDAGPAWGHSVIYLGSLPKAGLQKLYAQAAGLVLLSARENFGNVVAEALSQGCPAYVSTSVGTAFIVEQHGGGLSFPVASESDVHTAMERILSLSTDETVRHKKEARLTDAVPSLESFTMQLDVLLSGLVDGEPPRMG